MLSRSKHGRERGGSECPAGPQLMRGTGCEVTIMKLEPALKLCFIQDSLQLSNKKD